MGATLAPEVQTKLRMALLVFATVGILIGIAGFIWVAERALADRQSQAITTPSSREAGSQKR